jgi:hypothetical protein
MAAINFFYKKILIKGRSNKNIISISRFLDLIIFAVLFIFIILYQLQLIAPWISSLRVRELLYIYLYIRICFFYRITLNYSLFLIFLFLGYAVFVGINTYLFYGLEMAIEGFVRFINVALIAPLSSVLFTSVKQVKFFIYVWLVIVLLGAATAIYQLIGGELPWLVQDYIAIRGDLVRFKTILGEPNVGGMASVFVYVFALLSIRYIWLKLLFLNIAFLLLILSISKAAITTFVLATVIIVSFKLRHGFQIKKKKKYYFSFIFLIVLLIFILLKNTELIQSFGRYGTTVIVAFLGIGDNEGTDYGVIADLLDRILGKTIEGVRLAMEQSNFYLLDFLVGSSYGIAGTAAYNIRGDAAMLPHNGFLEIYLVGGIFMLIIFILILFITTKNLWIFFVKNYNFLFLSLFICFLLAIFLLPTYPIIYEPVIGALFWLIVGVAANWNFGSQMRKNKGSNMVRKN